MASLPWFLTSERDMLGLTITVRVKRWAIPIMIILCWLETFWEDLKAASR